MSPLDISPALRTARATEDNCLDGGWNNRNMNGLMAELETMLTPVMAFINNVDNSVQIEHLPQVCCITRCSNEHL